MNKIVWNLQSIDTGLLQNQIAENWELIKMHLQELKELSNNQAAGLTDRDME